MKKNVISGMAALSLLALVACSEENSAPVFNSESQVFTISVANKDAVPTRAGRPLYSQAYEQNIDNVKFVIVRTDAQAGADQNKIVYADEINSWMEDGGNIVTTSDGSVRQTTIELKGANKLVPGTYKAYAVGYSNSSNYTDLTDKLANLEVGQTFAPISVTTAGDAEEIFAGEFEAEDGSVELKVEENKGFTRSIVLKRQVAGTYGYFTNIPAKGPKGEDAKYLRLVASNKLKDVIFDGFDKTNAVNGKNSFDNASAKYFDGIHTGYEVYSITLKDWFTQGDQNSDGVLNSDDEGWQKDADITDSGVTFKKGSVFGGKFLVPFKAVEGTNTLQLQLLDGSGNILKYWNVNLQAKQETVNIVTDADDNEVAESTSIYSVLRNQLYTIGLRKADNGGETPDPGDGNDKPEDLNKGQNLIIMVDGKWENIPGMALD